MALEASKMNFFKIFFSLQLFFTFGTIFHVQNYVSIWAEFTPLFGDVSKNAHYSKKDEKYKKINLDENKRN